MPITWITDDEYIDEPWEVPHTAQEAWSNDKITCDVQLMCPWVDRYAVLRNILRHALPWPYHTSTIARAISGSVMSFNGEKNTQDGSGNSFGLACIGVHFESYEGVADEEAGNVIVYTEEIAPSAEFLTLPWEDFRWTSATGDKIKQEEAPGRLERGLDYCVTWNNLSSLPGNILTAAGCVNNAIVSSPTLNLSFPIETLLFQPPTASRSVSFDEEESRYTMKVRFSWKPSGWNKFWRTKTQAYEEIFHKDGGGTAYKNFPQAAFGAMVP